jgi:hypothetical protein
MVHLSSTNYQRFAQQIKITLMAKGAYDAAIQADYLNDATGEDLRIRTK